MKFSVGRIKLGTQTVAKCTGITIRFDGNPVEFHGGGCQEPLAIELGNRTTSITVDYAEWADLDVDSILTNEYVNVEILASEYDANRGLSGLTLNKCKAVSWEITSSQDGFVTYRLELRKAYSS